MSEIQSVLDSLNEAYRRDPLAIRALLINVVPCNEDLANHRDIQVHDFGTPNGVGYMVGTLGVINGVLASIGLPLVASMWSDSVDASGSKTLLGFMEYKPRVSKQ
jgi:hypothetical protein